jgi:hypothetical protein
MPPRWLRLLLMLATLLALLAIVLVGISDVHAQSQATCPPVTKKGSVHD